MTRVLVVGGGMGGCMAAIAALRSGAEVELVYRAPGATALASGAIDCDPASVEVSTLVDLVGQAGFEFACTPQTGTYVDCFGRSRRARLVPHQAAAGELEALRGRPVGVADLDGVGDYDAGSVALALRARGVEAEPVHVTLEGLPVFASLADVFGRPAPAVAGFDIVALPPGFDMLPESSFEVLANAVSPRGWQLQSALWAAVRALGARVTQRAVDGFESDEGRIRAAVCADGILQAEEFVLATGRYIGGGLDPGSAAEQLGLEQFHDGRPVADRHLRLRHLRYLDSASGFESGLLTDDDLRPLGRDLAAPYRNLRVAGSLLAGHDHECAGLAVALATGWRAGTLAASA